MQPTVSTLPLNAKIAVVGAGVSGLTFTYFLSKLRPDVNVTLYESKERCGGWIHSETINDHDGSQVMVEKGPRTLRGVSDGSVIIVETLRDLGKQDVIQYIAPNSEANRKFLLDQNDVLTQVPDSPATALKFISGSLGKGFIPGILGEPFRLSKTTRSDESAHSFIKRRFGNEYLSQNVFSALFHGIYAGDIKKLSAKRTIGKMVDMEKTAGSLIKSMLNNTINKYNKRGDTKVKTTELSPLLKKFGAATGKSDEDLLSVSLRLKEFPMIGFKTGLECYPKTLTEYITSLPNVTIKHEAANSVLPGKHGKGVIIESDSGDLTFEHARLTITPNILANMVQFEPVAKKLREVHSNTVLLVNFYLPHKDLLSSYHGFGYLVPQSNQNQEKLLGVIFDSVIEKNFKPVFESESEASKKVQETKYTKVTAMLGGHYLNNEGEQNIPSESIIINSVKSAFMKHLHIDENDLEDGRWEVTVAKDCLPQYHVGYDDWVQQTAELIQERYSDNVSLGGMAFSTGPGVPNVIEDAFESAYMLSEAN
ncbi:unnamed protein product [Kluyveromyces dobzhanskii CBS 2104]|uniref:Protoporphyrinogen oxidase n=1 Tax=Kluyveromyces dobzhanskii CBS 2104 TaxID=1427455 RepID=A0A0A8L2V9_9SACH|nr:unnamed protein product [Kluyveromyces dobzhanskii CBS 2104]